jgi:hypothetical protein
LSPFLKRAYEDGTECSETSAYKIQTPGNYPEENIQHTEHGESLKSRSITFISNAVSQGERCKTNSIFQIFSP